MKKDSTHNFKLLNVINSYLILFLMLLISNIAGASTNPNQQPLSNTQLAYYIGIHSYPGYYWRGPVYYRSTYWTKWRYIGHGCQKSCLIEKWSGRVIRCAKRCF